jgi:hypothetical protein
MEHPMTLITNRTGAHRKVREIPAGQIVTAIALLVLTVILALGVAIGSQPAEASTAWQARSAAMLAQDATHARPYWDGRHPKVWVGQDPMCLARYHGRHGWAGADKHDPRFRVECEPDGSLFAWNAIS